MAPNAIFEKAAAAAGNLWLSTWRSHRVPALLSSPVLISVHPPCTRIVRIDGHVYRHDLFAIAKTVHARFATEGLAYIWYRVNHVIAAWVCALPRPHVALLSAALATTIVVPIA